MVQILKNNTYTNTYTHTYIDQVILMNSQTCLDISNKF